MRSTELRDRFHSQYGGDLAVLDDNDAALVDRMIDDDLVDPKSVVWLVFVGPKKQ